MTTGGQTYQVVCAVCHVVAGCSTPLRLPGPSCPAATRPPSSGASSPKACSWRKMNWDYRPIMWV